MKEKRMKLIISLLALLVVILLFFVLYAFILKPAMNGFVVKAQNQGVEYALNIIAQASSNCQVVPITINNQTINIINVDCLQQAQQPIAQPKK
jgi:hypothetical protein